jgi:chromosome segregation ATPase
MWETVLGQVDAVSDDVIAGATGPEDEESPRRRAEDLEDVRQQRAISLAVSQAKREAQVDATLDAHGKRLQIINGSIERTAKGLESMNVQIEKLANAVREMSESQKHTGELTTRLSGDVKDMKSEQDRRDAVNEALVEAQKAKGTRRLSRFQTLGAGLAMTGVVGSFVFGLIQAIHP